MEKIDELVKMADSHDWVSAFKDHEGNKAHVIFDWCLPASEESDDKVDTAIGLLGKVYHNETKDGTLKFESYHIDKRDKPYVGIKMDAVPNEYVMESISVIINNVKSLLRVIGGQFAS